MKQKNSSLQNNEGTVLKWVNFILMKKRCMLFILCLTATGLASAQEYKKFKFGMGLGLSLSGTNYSYEPPTGIILTIEPAYHISDDLTMGLRIEGAATRFEFEYGGTYIQSYTVNSQYYLSNGHTRWFVGGGLGLYTIDGLYGEFKFGLYPRLGVDLGHFSVTLDYNIISAEKSTGQTGDSYFGIRMGGFFGGGKIQPPQTAQ
jgi:hypothetical protein